MREWNFFRYLNILIRKAGIFFVCVLHFYGQNSKNSNCIESLTVQFRNWRKQKLKVLILERHKRRMASEDSGKEEGKINGNIQHHFTNAGIQQTEKEKERTCKTSKITQQNILTGASLSVSVSLCLSTIVREGERDGGRDDGGGVRGSQTFKGMRRHRWRKRRKRGQDSPETPRFGP